jgi:hypothetical protein
MSARELADTFQVPREALRKRLERWQRKNPEGGYIEVENRRRGEPQYLYSVDAVRHLIDGLRASIEASAVRPSTGEGMG